MKSAFSIALLLFVGACGTPYQEMGLRGGVVAEPVTDDIVRISARGNAFTSRSSIQDFVLLKAAETTIERGSTHFVIVGAEDASRANVSTSPGTLTVNHYGAFSTGTYQPGSSSVVIKPGQNAIVRILRPNASDQEKSSAMDASQIIKNVGPRIQRD